MWMRKERTRLALHFLRTTSNTHEKSTAADSYRWLDEVLTKLNETPVL